MGALWFSVLASGSKGNTCYVQTSESRILIDAGLSCQETVRRLDSIGVNAEGLDGLVVTHEHSDHIKGVGALARRFNLPVYINQRTFRRAGRALGNLPKPVILDTGQTLIFKNLQVETFTKCHDAVDPIGIVFSSKAARVGLITDMGRSTALVEDRLKGCQALIIEFNHDVKMLEEGPYPLETKRRVKGPDGHLSNVQAGELLGAVVHKDFQVLIAAHISKINNHPKNASQQAQRILSERGVTGAKVLLSGQDEPGPLVELK
jgi:phosphoribosyl 1,2-cyclic phosphodiesterase